MFLNEWAIVLNQAFQTMLYGLVTFLPTLLAAVVIFILGWLVGALLGRVVAQVVTSLRVDQALRAAGVERVLQRAGFTLSSGAFLGMLVKWFFIAVFLVFSLEILGLNQVTQFLTVVVLGYLPRVIAAVLILLVAAVIADVAQRLIAGAARAAGLSAANLLGSIARWAIWIFAILAALEQLQVTPFAQTLFTGLVVALALAFGLAFGLGGQQEAARYLAKMRDQIKD